MPRQLGLEVHDPDSIVRPAGEELHARAELLGVHVGQLKVRLGPFCSSSGDDSTRVESRFDTAGMARWFRQVEGQTWTRLDPKTLFPEMSGFDLRNGGSWRKYALAFTQEGFAFQLETSKGDNSRGTHKAIDNVRFHDVHSAFLLLRSWKPAADARTFLYVVLGKAPWRIDVHFEGKDTIEYEGATTSTVHLTGTAHRTHLKKNEKYTPRNFQIWMTDDEQRLPLQVLGEGAFGSFRLLLERRDLTPSCLVAETEEAELRRAGMPPAGGID